MPESWERPAVPSLPGTGTAPRLHDTATGARLCSAPDDIIARLYVCGITPYDATHIGHANTYLAFDTLQRVWVDAGLEVHYAQNITDVDDPLLERAAATGVSWRDLADQQIELFRHDMTALRILPPQDYVAVTEVIDEIAQAVAVLLDRGLAYRVPTSDADADDVYFDISAAAETSPWRIGEESNLDREQMLLLSAERGGDPNRPGKRDPLDALLWRAAREGEPSWPSVLGAGRPGWHIECSVIALKHLGHDFSVQGGGADLVFPHHDLSAGHAAALSGHPLAKVYSHAGLIAYQGEKMSKSLGNLVLVSELLRECVPAAGIRLALLAHHYREEWEWTRAGLDEALARLDAWRGIRSNQHGAVALDVLDQVRQRLADDLDTPGAIAAVDRAVETGVDDPALIRALVDALLGIEL
ncbi:cysteine--1-D-myo-inosityl 2-amino-2-deoxy-alpha-D-glucopyranoside ligase [Humibacter sp.]|jgi:L-cysteine:1D-myo-inositol 2-amino-2-deoxy-alpha-D-glucopyranoside ligase|uniref:cysteine--1-D-myo-inosityl 2-amino-2-deoxy-alpha-D-glucopyranoside ligase n=1 Tax=Humibacter sp. TaxID=1940291 RepID=UPI002CD5B3E4|nr:cysteine--1-D-myo-inosityl 2-amino-2-deoxy-alpha-D-glucopyranoside ligase [Humibacter sp.]HVX08686.1 cysteine--1-D-myo-inosityl 2-amino-2-deoxy-alpha-D-glucopyranoside ligase [Humibacter sp.]